MSNEGSARHAPPLAAHRLLGDGHSTALLRPDGEIDWWCAPDLDSAPLLWSLLDADGAAARWLGTRSLRPASEAAGQVLDSVLFGPTGRIACRDALLHVDGRGTSLVRLVRGLDSDLALTHELAVGGFDATWGSWSGDPAGPAPELATTVGELRLRVLGGSSTFEGRWCRTVLSAPRGRWTALVVTLDPEQTAEIDGMTRELDRVARAAADQLSRARLPRTAPHRAADALRVLAACTYAPTGAVIASPTTSLPEAPGHDRQFDYRYSWLRDSSLAVSVAALLGRVDISERYLEFVLRQTQDRRLPSGPMTDVRGETVPAERTVDGIAGWAGSRPVRIGNDARDQLQYDALGLFVEAVSVALQEGAPLRAPVWELVRGIADELSADGLERCTSGIWELREPAELLSADIGIWLALDRALWIARVWRPWTRTHRRRWVRARHAARERVVGALLDGGGLPQKHGGGRGSADASALMAVVFRLLDRRDPRASRLLDATVRELGRPPLLYRYPPGGDDGFAGDEGAFVPASWWVVSALAACGRVEEARQWAYDLDRLLPPLMPEELDPDSGAGLGNTPLVWSHMEAARAMYVLDAARLRERWGVLVLTAWRVRRYLRARRAAAARHD